MARVNWSRDELVIAFNLYCKIPFGKIDARNPSVIELANVLGRTPSALAWKLANFASLDPALKQRQIKGARHTPRIDEEVWAEFNSDWSSAEHTSVRALIGTHDRKLIQLPARFLPNPAFLDYHNTDVFRP